MFNENLASPIKQSNFLKQLISLSFLRKQKHIGLQNTALEIPRYPKRWIITSLKSVFIMIKIGYLAVSCTTTSGILLFIILYKVCYLAKTTADRIS